MALKKPDMGKPKKAKKAKATATKKTAKKTATSKPKMQKKKARGSVSAVRREKRFARLIEQKGEKGARKIAGEKGVSAK